MESQQTPYVQMSQWREETILAHLPQVELLARRLHRRCPQVELEDLISEGTLGLIKAVDRFDPSRNLKVKTYAEHRIRGALLDYLRRIDPLPRNARQFQKKRDALIRSLGLESENQIEPQAAALALGMPLVRYEILCRTVAAARPVSLLLNLGDF